MLEFRVTKYDPAFRDERGVYTRDEWTAFRDIGKAFDGVILTESEYHRVEHAYVSVVRAFLQEANVTALTVHRLENPKPVPLTFAEGAALTPAEIESVVRRVLREEFWCRLEGPDAFIHIGWDYLMYIGQPCPCPRAQALAAQLGLFVEPFGSPYRE